MLPNILETFENLITLPRRGYEWVAVRARILWTHYRFFPIFFIFIIIRLFFRIYQKIQWSRNGITKKLDKIYHYGLDYEESAQILNVHLACKATEADKIRLMQFIASHETFAHPNYVLTDNCVLAEATPDYALFVQLKKPITEYSVRTTTFLWQHMHLETEKIILMPLQSLHRLATEIGTPKNGGSDVTFLWGSGRCGSTLIAKVVDVADPDNLVLSEPPILFDLYYFKHRMMPKEFARFTESVIRLLVKPINGKKRLFIKPIFFALNVAEDIHEVLPNSRNLYSYRKPLRTVWAHERAFRMTAFYAAFYCALLTNEWEWGERIIGFQRNPPVDYVSRRTLNKTMFDLCCIIWADNLMRYVDQAKKFYFPAIIYERLFDNPQQFCMEILSFTGADLTRIQDALDLVVKGDSQEGSLFSQKLLKGLSVTKVTPKLKVSLDQYCDELNLPRLELEYGPGANLGGVGLLNMEIPDGNNFITDYKYTTYEIYHAGIGSASGSGKFSEKLNLINKTQKRPQMQPYYKPLPLRVILSQD